MSLREIPRTEWTSFLEQFTRDHRAWLATVDRVDTGGIRQVEILERPLRAVTADLAVDGVVEIRIRFHPDTDTHDSVHVGAPKKLSVDENADGAARGMEIEDANGVSTRVRFRGAARPDLLLDGVAPAEL